MKKEHKLKKKGSEKSHLIKSYARATIITKVRWFSTPSECHVWDPRWPSSIGYKRAILVI